MTKLVECQFCGDKVYALREKTIDGTSKIVSACEDCWTYSIAYWVYETEGKFPEYKGILPNDKVWCRNRFQDGDEEWVRGIVSRIIIIKAGEKQMYLYSCMVENADEYEEDTYWEEDIWVRSRFNVGLVDDLDFEIDTDYENVKLHEKLYIYSYTDFF